MARRREFDVDAALARAMDVFWARGYERTSLDDLCRATGLSRSSLYGSFGSKRDLLLKTVERYVHHRTAAIAAVLDRPGPVRDAFAALLDQFIDAIVAGPGRRGCYLGNCAAELPRSDRAAVEHVRRGLDRTTALFRARLAAGCARGELGPHADPDALAVFLVAGIQGLRLVGKVNPDRQTLEAVAGTMLRCLDPSRETVPRSPRDALGDRPQPSGETR